MKKIIFVLLTFSATLAAYTQKDVATLKQFVMSTMSEKNDPPICSMCSQEKTMLLIDLTLEFKPSLCVDIGVYGGASLFPVAATLKFLGEGRVIGIDPWIKAETLKNLDPRDASNRQFWQRFPIGGLYPTFQNMIRSHQLENYCVTMKMTSEAAAPQITEEIDMLHLDGNHSEEGSMLDVLCYLPKVRKGGYIWITHPLWPWKQEAVQLLAESCDLYKIIENGECFLFKKR